MYFSKDSELILNKSCLFCVSQIPEKFPDLTSLRVDCDAIGDVFVQEIFCRFPNLQTLTLSYMDGVSDIGILGKRKIRLDNNIIKKQYVSQYSIENLKNLEKLEMIGSWDLTDNSFEEGFAKLKNLKILKICHLQYVTIDGIAALIKGCPLLEKVLMLVTENNDNFCEKAMDMFKTHSKHLRTVDIFVKN